MNDKEPWYMRPGWRSGWGFGVFLVFVPFIMVGIAAAFGWSYFYFYILERYDWLYSILSAIAIIPYGWLVAPALVIGATVVPGIFLCFFIHGHTSFGKTRVGGNILFCTGITLAAIGIGIFFGSMNV
jgi:hypothetical protein